MKIERIQGKSALEKLSSCVKKFDYFPLKTHRIYLAVKNEIENIRIHVKNLKSDTL